MRKFDPAKVIPFALVPVLACFVFDLTRVDRGPYSPQTDVVNRYGTLTMEDYVPLALVVLLPFGLGALIARRSPGLAAILLTLSMALAYSSFDLRESHWIPFVFPAAFVFGGLAAMACLNHWAHANESARDETAVTDNDSSFVT